LVDMARRARSIVSSRSQTVNEKRKERKKTSLFDTIEVGCHVYSRHMVVSVWLHVEPYVSLGSHPSPSLSPQAILMVSQTEKKKQPRSLFKPLRWAATWGTSFFYVWTSSPSYMGLADTSSRPVRCGVHRRPCVIHRHPVGPAPISISARWCEGTDSMCA
jgi:hypothetical protein